MGTFERVMELVGQDFALAARLKAMQDFSRTVRTSEYHLTNACNIRCKGCWFFAYDYDRKVHEVHELSHWREFAARERAERKITTALLIGGIFIGIGAGIVNPSVAAAALGTVPVAKSGMASGLNSTFRLLGVAIGVVAGLGLTRLMAHLLYGVSATDPVTFAAVAAVLAAVPMPAVRG